MSGLCILVWQPYSHCLPDVLAIIRSYSSFGDGALTLFCVVHITLECSSSVGDLMVIIDVNPNEAIPIWKVTQQFRYKMKFLADIVSYLNYGTDTVHIGVAFLSYTNVSDCETDKSTS